MFLLQIQLTQQWLFLLQHEVAGDVGEQVVEEIVVGVFLLFFFCVANLGLYPQQLRDQMVLVVGSCWQIWDHQGEVRCTCQPLINRIVFLAAVVPQKFKHDAPNHHADHSQVILNLFVGEGIGFVAIRHLEYCFAEGSGTALQIKWVIVMTH